jgi:hypothetical protein
LQGCADDVVLLQKGKIVSTLCDRMQGALNCVENWCRVIGLSVNADKATMVLIHISDFYQMFQSLKQFLEDYVPKKRHAKFQAGWCP